MGEGGRGLGKGWERVGKGWERVVQGEGGGGARGKAFFLLWATGLDLRAPKPAPCSCWAPPIGSVHAPTLPRRSAWHLASRRTRPRRTERPACGMAHHRPPSTEGALHRPKQTCDTAMGRSTLLLLPDDPYPPTTPPPPRPSPNRAWKRGHTGSCWCTCDAARCSPLNPKPRLMAPFRPMLTHTHTHTHTQTHTHTRTHTHTHTRAHTHTHTHTHTRARTHARTHAHAHARTRKRTHTHTHTRTHTRADARTHANAHAHTHTHTHTHTHSSPRSCAFEWVRCSRSSYVAVLNG